MILFFGWVITSQNQTDHANALQQTVIKKQVQLKKVDRERVQTEAELKAKVQHEADLQQQIDSLNQQLQAKREAQQTLADAVPAPQPVAQIQPIAYQPQPVAYASGCGDNFYATFIYEHESGCNAYAINASSGACGIGQELPCGKSGCALGDYTCQNAYFTSYANKYGGWAGAYQFWLQNRWW